MTDSEHNLMYRINRAKWNLAEAQKTPDFPGMRNLLRDAIHELNLALQRIDEVEARETTRELVIANRLPDLRDMTDQEVIVSFNRMLVCQVTTIGSGADRAAALAIVIGNMCATSKTTEDYLRAKENYAINDAFRREFQRRVDA